MSLSPAPDDAPHPHAADVLGAGGRGQRRTRLLIFGFAAVFVAAGAVFVAYDLTDRRQRALQAGFADAENLSRVIEVQAQQSIQGAALSMRQLRSALRVMPRGADETLHAQMRSAAEQMEHVRALFILDENGVMVHDSDTFPAKRIDFSDREYFTAHRDNPARGLYIGPPIQSRTTGAYFIALSLRVEKPGGGFGGVVVAALEPDFFARLYATIDVGRGGVVALFLADGTLLARAPAMPAAVGKPAPDPGFRERVRSGAARETYAARSGYDGVFRLVSYRAIPGLPLACVVGLERDAVLAEWRSHTRGELLLFMVFTLTAILFAFVLDRQLRRAGELAMEVGESERRYRYLFHANPLPMWLRDERTQQFLDVNDAALTSYGYTREAFLRLKVDDLIPPDGRQEWRRYLASAPLEGVLFRTGQHVRKDGNVIDVEVTSHAFNYGGIPARLSLVNDVTERKRAEAALRERHFFMEKAQEVAHIGYWVSGPSQSGTRLVWSPEAHRIFGIPEADFDGRVETFFALVHPEDLDWVKSESAAALAGQRQYRVEHRIVRPDGTLRWVYQEADVTFDPAGQPLQMFGVTQDVTERKQAEIASRESAEAIRKLNAELEQRVADRTAQLEATNRELEAFAYSVSHDLRAPLRSIDGFSKALLEDYGAKLDADGKDYLDRVRSATHRMSNLIDDLLVLSRVARSEIRSDAVDLGALARDIVEELRRVDPSREVSVDIETSLNSRGDAELLRVLLQNLLENAWKFTARNPGARIEFGADRRNGRVEYFVRDNGVGFDMAYAGKLFGAFQRLHAASDFAGTGIGLATVLRIVRRHGGEVRAEAAVGKGATFRFTLGQ